MFARVWILTPSSPFPPPPAVPIRRRHFILCNHSFLDPHAHASTLPAQVLGPNGQVARYGYVGIAASPATRQARDVAGERLQVAFEVLDKRVAFADNGTLLPGGRGPYNVTVVLKVRDCAGAGGV